MKTTALVAAIFLATIGSNAYAERGMCSGKTCLDAPDALAKPEEAALLPANFSDPHAKDWESTGKTAEEGTATSGEQEI